MRSVRVGWVVVLLSSTSCLTPVGDDLDAGFDAGLSLDAGVANDAGVPDSGSPFDSGTPDAGAADAGAPDAGTPDAGTPDAGTPDAGCDASFFNGTWVRMADGFAFTMSAIQCAVTGRGDTSQLTHTLTGVWDPAAINMPISIDRVNLSNNCRTVMSGSLTMLAPTQYLLSITGTDGHCDLAAGYNQAHVFVKQP